MLRVLEHGYRIKMVLTDFETCSVDTSEDLEYVEEVMRGDPLVHRYGRGRPG
jgi:3-deoxy-manno-octulosonate cytidylyltransferase (CMP-KDO synthetase)